MPRLVLDIALPAERLLAVYKGQANRILVRSRDGIRVSLPAHHFRPFTTTVGVYGSFEMEFSEDGKLTCLRKLD